MANTPGHDSAMTDLTKIAGDLEKQDTPIWQDGSFQSEENIRSRSTAFLDGLRGLAALMVYMSHHMPWFYGFDSAVDSLERGFGDGSKSFAMLPFVRVFFTGGSAAVAIFFVLSGYVLSARPLSILREGPLRKCYVGLVSATVRRPLRLFLPAAGVSLIFAFVMQLPFGLAPHMTWPEAKANIFLQLGNWADEFWRIIDPFEAHGIAVRWFPYNPPLWTIAIEFRGSLVVFALIAVYSRVTPRLRLLLFALTGAISLIAYQWSLACFMAGVVLATFDQENIDINLLKTYSPRARAAIHTTILLTGWYFLSQPAGTRDPMRSLDTPGFYYLTRITPPNYLSREYWRFYHAIGSVLVVSGILNLRLPQRFFNSPPLRFLGKHSFALYLTHIPFLWTIGDRIYRSFGHATMDFQTVFDNWLRIPDIGPRGLSSRFVISQICILSVNLWIATKVTRWLDEPSVKAGRWLSKRVVPEGRDGVLARVKEVDGQSHIPNGSLS